MEHDVSELRRRLAEAERRETEARQHETEARQRETEARQRETEARQRETEARQREIEAQRQLNEARLQSQQTEQRIQETTLPEFLDACHVHLFLGLGIQPNPGSTTKGDPANADNKLRPAKIREWMGFPQEQTDIWAELMGIDFVTQRHFLSLLVLEQYGKDVRQRMLSSELDLGYFERFTIESRVAEVIEKLYASPQLREVFGLKGKVEFENHANTLTDESVIAADMGSPSLAQKQPSLAQKQPSLAQEQPSLAQQQPSLAQQQPSLAQQQPSLAQQQPSLAQQQPSLAQKQPSLAQQQPSLAQKQPSLAQEQPRRSRRVAKKSPEYQLLPDRPVVQPAQPVVPPAQPVVPPAQPVVKHQGPALRKPSRPRADQFCVYNKGPEETVPAFIVEYKAPHKFTLAHIKAGLREMELDQVVRYQESEKPEDTCQRVVAAVITQAFSYMIKGGMEYGYVCTGEAFIFLRVPHEDPSTVYYYLSIPREDVGDTTGWTGNPSDDNRLHLTALGQVLAFTLRALQTSPRGIQWQTWAESKLDTWKMIYDDLWGEISELDVPSSVFKSPKSRSKYCRVSPVKTRSKSTVAGFASCAPLEALSSSESDDSPDGSDPNTPSRQPQGSRFTDSSALPPSSAATIPRDGSYSKGKSRQYCTQRCLLGLVTRGILDQKCPNVLDHGVGRHSISQATLIRLLDRQLSQHDPRPDLDIGCESLHIHGTRGALFKVTLLSHGYTFVGKGAPIDFVEHAQHEECVYSRLRPIQGVHVPVLLGGLDLRQPFSYDGIAEIVHLMLMGYAGRTLAKRHEIDRNWLIQQAETSLHAIHGLGVLHNDPIPGNMIWNEGSGRVMYIDFERAQFQDRRAPLESKSPNQKRKQATQSWEKSPNKRPICFERETRRMRHAILW